MRNESMTQVAIVGASFAGLRAYAHLKKKGPKDLNILLIDREPVATYIPSLHLALGNEKYIHNIQLPTKEYYPEFICAEVTAVGKNALRLKDGTVHKFDYLIDATGAPTNFFGNESFQKNTYPAKTAAHISALNRKLRNVKKITIVGGGLTGVEYAGILATRTNKTISLVTASDRLVPGLPQRAAHLTERFLKRKNVQIYKNARATHADEQSLTLGNGRIIGSDIIIWCAGIAQRSRLVSEALAAQPNVFLAGDVRKSNQVPTAHNAMLCGEAVAKCIVGKLEGKQVPLDLHNWETLALALGSSYGVLIIKNKYVFRNMFTGIMKWLIEWRVMKEWKNKKLYPI